MVKNPPANAGDARDMGSTLGQEGPLEKEMATHSCILAWRITWTGEPGRLQSIESQRMDMTEHTLAFSDTLSFLRSKRQKTKSKVWWKTRNFKK